MSTIFECDWCGKRFSDRAAVASVDVTVQSVAETVHMCHGCLPDWISDQLDPLDGEEVLVTDGGTDLVTACPECAHHNVRQRDDGTWRCGECEAEFSRPMRRPRRHGGGNYSAAGDALRHADPDDLRADGGVHLGADGSIADQLLPSQSVTTSSRDNPVLYVPTVVIRALGHPDRVSVVDRDGTALLQAGKVDAAFSTYSVNKNNSKSVVCYLRGRAIRRFGWDVGERLSFRPDDDGVRIERLVADGGLPKPFGLRVLTLAALFEGKPRGFGELRRQLERTCNQEVDLTPVLDDLIADGYVTHGPEGGYQRTERGANLSHRIITTAAEFEEPADQTWRLDDDGWERVDGTARPRDPDGRFQQ